MILLWGLLVFTAAAVTAVPWARYTLAVSRHHAVRAGLWDIAIYVFGAISILAYTTNPWLLPFAALGGGVGTSLTVAHARRHIKT